MEYLNKLNKFRSTLSTTVESTVFSTVSTITNALPGNPVTRDFEVFEHVASGGPGILTWQSCHNKFFTGFPPPLKCVFFC
jgi:hypothetical protein